MATVYSLICWGGSEGKSVAVDNVANTITCNYHGLYDATGIAFTSGTLPDVAGPALSLNTVYYSKQVVDVHTLELYYDEALTQQIDFSTAGASLIMKSAFYLSLTDTSRWFGVYESINAACTARAPYSVRDVEDVFELGERLIEYRYYGNQSHNGLTSLWWRIIPKIDGVNTTAFHGGNQKIGYRVEAYSIPLADWPDYNNIYLFKSEYCPIHVYGFEMCWVDDLSTYRKFLNLQFKTTFIVDAMIFNAADKTTFSAQLIGHNSSSYPIFSYTNNLIINGGIQAVTQAWGGVIAHNTIINLYASTQGLYCGPTGNYLNAWNNAAYNTSYSATPAQILDGDRNAGPSGSVPWKSPTGTSIVGIVAADFANYPNDFRLSSTSQLRDAGKHITHIPELAYDLAGNERPSYNNGDSEYVDVGCYEFDNGYGDHPTTATVKITNIVTDSRVRITRDDTSAVLYNGVPGTSLTHIETTYVGPITIVIRKASGQPNYREFSAATILTAGQVATIKALQQLDE